MTQGRQRAGPAAMTDLLQAWSGGDRDAGERLMGLVYDELRRQAARHLRRERRDHTLRPTALVHEAYLRLMARSHPEWPSRGHFFALAARVMRHILVDHARRHRAARRGGSWCRVSLDAAEAVAVTARQDVDVLAVEEALGALAALDAEQARLVELRFFGGLSIEETADVMGVSAATVKREWRTARAWLQRRLTEAPAAGAAT